jgi:hypothetical protein
MDIFLYMNWLSPSHPAAFVFDLGVKETLQFGRSCKYGQVVTGELWKKCVEEYSNRRATAQSLDDISPFSSPAISPPYAQYLTIVLDCTVAVMRSKVQNSSFVTIGFANEEFRDLITAAGLDHLQPLYVGVDAVNTYLKTCSCRRRLSSRPITKTAVMETHWEAIKEWKAAMAPEFAGSIRGLLARGDKLMFLLQGGLQQDSKTACQIWGDAHDMAYQLQRGLQLGVLKESDIAFAKPGNSVEDW